jgi:hypothetical protein
MIKILSFLLLSILPLSINLAQENERQSTTPFVQPHVSIKLLTQKIPENTKTLTYSNKYVIQFMKVNATLTRQLPNNRQIELSCSINPDDKKLEANSAINLEEFLTFQDVLDTFLDTLIFKITQQSNFTDELEQLKQETTTKEEEKEVEKIEKLIIYREILDSYPNVSENSNYPKQNYLAEILKPTIDPKEIKEMITTVVKHGLKRKAEEELKLKPKKQKDLKIATFLAGEDTLHYSLTYSNPLDFGTTTLQCTISKQENLTPSIPYLTEKNGLEKLITVNFLNLIQRHMLNIVEEINRKIPKTNTNTHHIYN